MMGIAIVACHQGGRKKFTFVILCSLFMFQWPVFFAVRLLPGMLCLTDLVDPLLSVAVYPTLATTYELVYMFLIPKIWNSQCRRDTPELGLHFVLALIHCSSESLFFSGLVLISRRYSQSRLPLYYAFSILYRFCSKLFDRSGLSHYLLQNCCGPNRIDAHRDLMHRHASCQSWYGVMFVLMLLPNGIGLWAVESVTGEDLGTAYTKGSFWIACVGAAIGGVLLELCVARLTWWQRRESPE